MCKIDPRACESRKKGLHEEIETVGSDMAHSPVDL
jgi:hypothetical protein